MYFPFLLTSSHLNTQKTICFKYTFFLFILFLIFKEKEKQVFIYDLIW